MIHKDLKISIKGKDRRSLNLTVKDTWIKIPILKYELAITRGSGCNTRVILWIDPEETEGKGIRIVRDAYGYKFKHHFKSLPKLYYLDNYKKIGRDIIRIEFLLTDVVIKSGRFDGQIGVEIIVKKDHFHN